MKKLEDVTSVKHLRLINWFRPMPLWFKKKKINENRKAYIYSVTEQTTPPRVGLLLVHLNDSINSLHNNSRDPASEIKSWLCLLPMCDPV